MRIVALATRLARSGDHRLVIFTDRECPECFGFGLRLVEGDVVVVCHCVDVERKELP